MKQELAERRWTTVNKTGAEGVGFEPTRERNPLPVFKTGALNHSATLPYQQDQRLRYGPAGTFRQRNQALDPSWTQSLLLCGHLGEQGLHDLGRLVVGIREQ